MAGSFSRELEDLLNPLPKFADPEDDGDEATKARVVERFSEDDDDDDDDGGGVGLGLSALRKNNRSLLSDSDRRYVGKAVSRKQLLMLTEGSGEEDEEEEDDDDDEEDDSVHEDEVDSMGDEEPEEGDDDDNDDDLEEEEEEEEYVGSNAKLDVTLASRTKSDLTLPHGVDFHKLTEGMDELGVSEDEDDSGDAEQDSDDDMESDDEDGEDEETVRTFSKEKVHEEVEKGKAVKNQLTLWDQLLEGRIKLQKALVTANQLPQPQTFPEFKERGGSEFAGALKITRKALKALQRSLLELHDQLLYQNPDTRAITLGKAGAQSEDEEINSDGDEQGSERGGGAPKRKLEMAEYPDFMAKRFSAFQSYQNATLQKWHDKTRLSMGKSSKSFGAFDRNILTQVEQVLMDKERLVQRTQTRRSEYRVLGKREASALASAAVSPENEEEEQQVKANMHLKDVDPEIFDDDDFYHQLLRELIERRTSAADPNDQVAMGRQWLAIQKLRSKIKKKVDTKASKGRKVRFHIHSKLVNFMAPMDHSSMSDEARSELYRGLFGQNSSVRE